jgi:hypothetical protein
MADGVDFDRAEQWLKDSDAPDFVLSAIQGSSLRKKISELEGEVTRLKPFESKVQKDERAPVKEAAFEEAGFDLSKLTVAQKKLLDSFDFEGESPDADKVKSFASELEFPLKDAAGSGQAETPASGRIANAATGATGAVPPSEKSLQERISQAESEGQWATALTLKTQLLEQAARS